MITIIKIKKRQPSINKMQKLIEQILNFEESQVSVKTQNNFYFKIKELIEYNFQEEEAKKIAYLEDLKYYHNAKYMLYIEGGSSTFYGCTYYNI